MGKNEELFVLIKSLTRSEKRYFKLMSGQVKKANYLQLFDAIDKQDKYDEVVIKKKFKDATFIKQLHVTKHYLREQILNSLRSFHNCLSKDAELKQLLRNIEILYHKELYQLCSTEIEKATKLAEKYELLLGQVELFNWKRKLEQAIFPSNYSIFMSYAQEQRKLIDIMLDTNVYWQHMIWDTWNMFGDKAEVKKYNIIALPKEPATLEAMIIDHNIKYIRWISSKEQVKAQKELYKLIELLEKYPHRLKEDPSPYVSTINNLVGYLMFQRKDKEVHNLLAKAKKIYNTFSIKTENRSLLKQIMRTYSLELELYRNSKMKDNCVPQFVITTELFLEKNKNKMPKDYLLSLWFQLAHIRFVSGDYDNALKWLNNILNTKFGTTRIDLQTQARMLNLIVHFEQKNFFVLRYFVDSTKRFLKKSRALKPFETVLLKFFTKLSTAPQYEYNTLFKNVHTTLFPKSEESQIPNDILDYIDYKMWIEANIKKKA